MNRPKSALAAFAARLTARERPSPAPAPSQRPMSVLFVDDDPIAREAAVCHWADDTCSVDTVKDGAEACLALNSRRYDVMVLDLAMPKFDGFHVLRYARSHADHAGLPIVVVTSRTDDEARDVARKEGATLYCPKPVQWSELKVQLQALADDGGGWGMVELPHERRTEPREGVLRRAAVVDQTSGESRPCLVLEISASGARLQLLTEFEADSFVLVDGAMGNVHGCSVSWRRGPLLGVTFTGTVWLP